LLSEITSMTTRVQYNSMNLIDGTWTQTALTFQIGPNTNQQVTLTVGNITAESLAAQVSLALGNADDIGASTLNINQSAATVSGLIDSINAMLDIVAAERARLGAASNRLDFTMRSLDVTSENLSDAESRVRNADMAREMMRFTMANVLQQSSVSMLAQANQLPNNLLQLLR